MMSAGSFSFEALRARKSAKSSALVPLPLSCHGMGMQSRLINPAAIDFCAWLAQAEPGDVLQYHQGFLALDVTTCHAAFGTRERRALVRLADHAYQAAEQGLVHLVQRRLGPYRFAYLAIARTALKEATAAECLLRLREAA